MEKTIQFIQVSPNEFREEIIKGILEIMNPVKEQEELLTQTEVCAFYKVSKPTIIKWQKEGKIKAYSIDNERRYKKSELLESLVLMK
jgi:excisionase family DNA binding protein